MRYHMRELGPRLVLGFTLTELMITLAVVIILAAIAVPNYRQHLVRSHRGDAMQALLRIAAEQEKFYLQNNTYADEIGGAGLPIPNVSENGWYDLAITAGDANGFTATATPDAGGSQADDAACQEFRIDELGRKLAFDENDDPNDEYCWR